MSQVREIAWLTSHKLEAALRIREWREHTKAPVGAAVDRGECGQIPVSIL
jgi:hypothetical protein